ncbi:hypothetical protein [Amycolatopsis keratiniphila]|uniref:hypothetical protein n=1 Tax=Amycolatopsis keratiniphila TaxID=129921 RepID=UPI000879B7BE|nr:hypothetical protein [Amycolatopsis keratiniphila]OLZ50260.1 hypothetical protein BS330_28750 [Amycolatopsis keratiniphila subsp. nogabecina]SDU66916.1 hypothetical protein SAMN04489733_8030 [Amycolatopsis keratiniphila]
MSNGDIPQPPRRQPDDHHDGTGAQQEPTAGTTPEQQIAVLRAAVSDLRRQVAQQHDLAKDLAIQLQRLVAEDEADPDQRRNRPAPWVPFEPPGRTEPDSGARDPLVGVALFVEYYNTTYVGLPGSRAVAIPDCWLSHPGLLAEVATLAYFWRAANTGPRANVKDAQYWHHTFRPGFAARLASEWTHAHCRASSHKDAGAPARPDRYSSTGSDPTPNDTAEAQATPAADPQPDSNQTNYR